MKRWSSAYDIEWNILLNTFINQRRTLIFMFGSVTGKGKNFCTWSSLYMLFYRWFYLIDFASLDLRSMNLLYLRHCYLFMWFWAWVCYINTYVSAIDSMIIWVWHIYYTAKFELINEVRYYSFMKNKEKEKYGLDWPYHVE